MKAEELLQKLNEGDYAAPGETVQETLKRNHERKINLIQLYADKQSREVATQFCAWFESVSHRHKGRTWLEIYDEWKSKEGE